MFFDGSSGTGAAVWNTSISLATLDCTGSKNTVTHSASVTLTISSGNLVLPTGVGGTYGVGGTTSVFTITGTSGTQQITTNGFAPGGLTLNGTGGTFQLQDALTLLASSASCTITLTAGTFDTQGFAVTAAKFASAVASARVLIGTGLWTLGQQSASGTIWSSNTSSFTLTGFTSNITIAAANTGSDRTFAGGNATLAGTLTVGANPGGGQFIFTGSNTLGNFVPSAQWFTIPLAASLTLTNAPTIAGSSGSEVFISSNNPGNTATISVASGTAAFSWCAFRDIIGAGGATFTATDSFDLGHNSGITINAPGGSGSTVAGGGVIGG